MAGEGFLGRWSRLKRDAEVDDTPIRDDAPASLSLSPPPVGALAPDAGHPGVAVEPPSANQQSEPDLAREGERVALPSIDSLGTDSDYSMFMHAGVDPELRVSALKKLFTDPRFNQMDGLDIYIDDYSKPDPMPLAMLRRLSQSRLLGLMEEDPEPKPVAEDLPSVAAGDGATATSPQGALATGADEPDTASLPADAPPGGARRGDAPSTEAAKPTGPTRPAVADAVPLAGRQS